MIGSAAPSSTRPACAIHLDAVGGIAGDMFVAALLDAQPQLEARVLADVAAVVPATVGTAQIEQVTTSALAAKRFGMAPAPHPVSRLIEPFPKRPSGGLPEDFHATLFPDMVARIRGASLSAGTADHAVGILTILAAAEARVHGLPMDRVHFHELADWDSLMDVVAAGSIAGALEGARWTVSSLPRGSGLIQTQHGKIPVPAPATAIILEGFDWREDGVAGERVTPTGAAIVRHLVQEPGRRPGPLGRLQASGMGAGTRILPGMPNIVRATLFLADEQMHNDEIVVISFDVDDMTGEEIGVAADRLRECAGVLDLSIGTRLGKKSRPVADFRLLVRPERAAEIGAACMIETSTIGLRWRREFRNILPRTQTAAGDSGLPSKTVTRPDGSSTTKVESDALRDMAGLARRRAAGQRGDMP